MFIRPLINTGNGYGVPPLFRPGLWWDTMLFPITDLVTAFNAGAIQSYRDVILLPNYCNSLIARIPDPDSRAGSARSPDGATLPDRRGRLPWFGGRPTLAPIPA